MKVNEIILEANTIIKPKKGKKKTAKKKPNLYKPAVIAKLDLQEVAIKAANNIAKFIKSKCKPWYNQSKQGKIVVYRGVDPGKEAVSSSSLAFIRKTRPDRRPKDTDMPRHKAFNAVIGAAGGIANRSNSLFTTSKYDIAADYGTVFATIPIGDFHYTWSPYWSDWTHDVKKDNIVKLLKEPEVAANIHKVIATLEGQIGAYKEKAKVLAKKAYDNEVKYYVQDIAKEKARYAKLKSKSSYAAQNIKYQIKEDEMELKLLRTPAGMKRFIEKKTKAIIEYNTDSPVRKIRELEGRQKRRPFEDALDPKNYDTADLKEYIYVDRNLGEATFKGNEVMISCDSGLYIKPGFYKKFVLPLLQNKKITTQYSSLPGYGDEEEEDL